MNDRMQDRLIKLPEVMRRTGLSRRSIYRRGEEGTFPVRIVQGVNSVAWYESDIGRWISDPGGWHAEPIAA